MTDSLWEAWKRYWAASYPAWDAYNKIALRKGRQSEAALEAFKIYDEIVIAAGVEWHKVWDKEKPTP